ncbi:hypothetical protein VNO77_04123 [Canavalia gladiata]|uniref:Uncharacterized protein n=1 Tax=Canavalia gladiata TaxID=3824 RepID=A0AAN9MWT5_CANGL
MWAFRRASLRLKSEGLNAGASRASCDTLVPTTYVENEVHREDHESEADLSDGDEDGEKLHDVMELLDGEIDPTEKITRWKGSIRIFQGDRGCSWFVYSLRSSKLFEWLESNKKLEFMEKDYASRLGLIAKLRGILKAEKYFETIPKSFEAALVQHYTFAGLEGKVGAVLKEVEGENLTENRWRCPILLRLHANLGKVDEVERIWEAREW